MDIENNKHLDDFLLDRLKGSELEEFQKALQENPKLSTAMQQQKELIGVIDALGDLEMKDRIRRLQKQDSGKSAIIRRFPLYKVTAIAAAVLVLLIGWWQFSSTPPAQIAESYYEQYDLNFGVRNTGQSEEQTSLQNIETAYQNKEYQKSIELLEALLVKAPNNSKAWLGLGVAYMEIKDCKQAITKFNYLIDKKDALYFDEARWYAAIAHIQIGEVAQGEALLEALSQNGRAKFQTKAQAFLAELK